MQLLSDIHPTWAGLGIEPGYQRLLGQRTSTELSPRQCHTHEKPQFRRGYGRGVQAGVPEQGLRCPPALHRGGGQRVPLSC